MADLFTDAAERDALVNDASARLGVAPWVVEKDLWVCWLLARLHELEGTPPLTFKGGTSLSKVYGLIQRFSEDIDLTFSREGWGFDGDRDPLADGLSNKQRDRLVEQIAETAAGIVRDRVAPALAAACGSALGASGWTLTIDDADPQTLLFGLPTPAAAYGYGRPVVKVEFGARGEPWPTAPALVRPYLEELYPGVAPGAVVMASTLAAERTFWEKATLLHALHHGTLAKPDKRTGRLSRHLYDLHKLWVEPTLNRRLRADPDLLLAVVHNKSVFFKEGKARYDLVREFTLNATPHAELERSLRADYVAMSSMFFPGTDVPSFDALLTSLREIDQAVAAWQGRQS